MISDNEIPFAKVYKPSLEEFADFERFVENLDNEKVYENYGLVKVEFLKRNIVTINAIRLYPRLNGKPEKVLLALMICL